MPVKSPTVAAAAVLALLLSPTTPASGRPDRGAAVIAPPVTRDTGGIATAVRGLSAVLDRAAVPPGPDPCGLTVAGPGETTLDMACGGLPPDPNAGGSQAANPGLRLEEEVVFEAPRFWTEMAALDGGVDGAVLRVHGYGEVAAMDSAGETLWRRPSLSFFPDWAVEPWVVPFVPLGRSPVDPFIWASERAFAVGDLTGDGADDVVVAHLVWGGEPDPAGRSMVTVLDGGTGETLWTRSYSGAVTQVLLVGDTLLVGEETGPRTFKVFGPIGQNGTNTRLHAVSFTDGLSGLESRDRWTFPTGRPWARWLALEPAGDARVAVAWTAKPIGEAGEGGRVVVLDSAQGLPLWQRGTEGYPRMLRHDPGRGVLVVHEQADFVHPVAAGVADYGFSYSLTALDAAGGSERLRVEREDALLLSLAVGDVAGDVEAEWVTGDAEITDLAVNEINLSVFEEPASIPETVEAGRVIATSGGDGQERWRRTTTADSPGGPLLTYGLVAAQGRFGPLVAAASFAADGTDLRVLEGGDGRVRWEEQGDVVAFPLSVTATRWGDDRIVCTMTESLTVRSYELDGGDVRAQTPLLADVFAAAASDVDGDGQQELLLGTHGGGVFAVDPVTLGEEPEVLWRVTVGGSVRMLKVADVTGDGALEVVVAATTEVHVLRGSDGSSLYAIPFPDEFVWTVAVGDLTDDGVADIVVPTRTLSAHRGTDGLFLWRFHPADHRLTLTDPPPPNPKDHVTSYFSTAVVAGGKAVAAFNVGMMPRHHHLAVAVDGATGEVAWQRAHAGPSDITLLWRSAVLLPGQGRDGGDAVGFVYDAAILPVGWRPAALVYDLGSGDLLWRSGPAEFGTVHEGTVVHEGDFLQLTWSTLARFRPAAADVLGLDGPASSMAFGDPGTAGDTMLASWIGVRAFARDMDWSDPLAHLAPLATWDGLHTGELVVTDLDGDGTDEVVAFRLDEEARSRVAGYEGSNRFGWSFLPYGVTILAIRTG